VPQEFHHRGLMIHVCLHCEMLLGCVSGAWPVSSFLTVNHYLTSRCLCAVSVAGSKCHNKYYSM